MAVIRDLLGHAQRHADWKVLRASGAGKIEIRRTKIATDANFLSGSLPKTLPKMDFAPFSGTENGDAEAPLTGSFERCYVPELALLAGVAKLAYAADSKSAGT